jgi:hypothetical protein
MRRLIWMASVAAALGACFLDPTCEDACDGDRIASCQWECDRNPDHIAECHRIYGGTDCAALLGASGAPKRCKIRTSVNNAVPDRPYCMDAEVTCAPRPGNLFCTGPHSIAECWGTTDGVGYAQPVPDSSPYCATEGTECTNVESGTNCVDSPKVPCDPAEWRQRCLDDTTLQFCLGSPSDGYFTRTILCAECTGDGVCTLPSARLEPRSAFPRCVAAD